MRVGNNANFVGYTAGSIDFVGVSPQEIVGSAMREEAYAGVVKGRRPMRLP